jgi:hypothetical protein
VLLAKPGHPESPHLWEKHAEAILCKIGLFPMTHESCLYSGVISGHPVLFLREVNNFAIACSEESTSNTLLDLIDDELTIPVKQMGLLDLYNGLNVIQTCDHIKITCLTYSKKILEKHLLMWMKSFGIPAGRPTPLPSQ